MVPCNKHIRRLKKNTNQLRCDNQKAFGLAVIDVLKECTSPMIEGSSLIVDKRYGFKSTIRWLYELVVLTKTN